MICTYRYNKKREKEIIAKIRSTEQKVDISKNEIVPAKKMETKMNEVIKADKLYVFDFLRNQGTKAKLIYADPPYGVGGENYGYDCYKYKTFGERFYKLTEKCRELLTDDGSIWK